MAERRASAISCDRKEFGYNKTIEYGIFNQSNVKANEHCFLASGWFKLNLRPFPKNTVLYSSIG